ncbi:MAG TPA: hypothetical protein VFC15_12885 [Candidatus Limnocylindrales bacterium]|nr:hypothetical protein [Candidatus Limnocylindrales bacterium]
MKNERVAVLKKRLRALWRDVKAARGQCTDEIIAAKFCALAGKSGLTAALGRYGEEDIAHVVSWALRGMNPFETGPLHGEPRE